MVHFTDRYHLQDFKKSRGSLNLISIVGLNLLNVKETISVVAAMLMGAKRINLKSLKEKRRV